MSQSGNVFIQIGVNGANQAAAAFGRVGDAVKSNGKNIDAALSSSNHHFKNVEGSIGSLAKAAAGLYIFSKVASAIQSTVSASLSLEKVQRGLKYATGSAEGAAESFQFLQVESARLGLDLKSSASEFTKLAAAAATTSLRGQATADIFTAVSEAATVMGLTAAESAGALNAVQQMISKGVISTEELGQQLGERLPGAFDLAAKSIGKTTPELRKLLQTGSVLSEEFLPKFAAELHKTFGSAAEAASNQGQGAINKFNSALFKLEASLGQAVMPALVEVTSQVSFLFAEAEKSGKLQEAFREVGSAVVFVAKNLETLIHVGEAVLAVFAVQKLVAVTVAIRGMVLAVQALTLANPILAALTLTVGAGVIAYQQAKGAAEDFNNEAKNIKEAERILTKYGNEVDSLTVKFKKLGEQWKDKSPFPNVAAPTGTPANPATPTGIAKPLTADQVTDLAKLQKEANAARLEVMYQGAALAAAQENADHAVRVKTFNGVNELIAAEAKRHGFRLQSIAKQAAEETKSEVAKVTAEHDRIRQAEAEAISTALAARKDLESQVADAKIAVMAEGSEKQLAEIDRQQERERTAFIASDAFKVASAQNIADILSGIEKTAAQKRIGIQKNEAESSKKIREGQVAVAAEMASNVIGALDASYAQTRKNALLHKSLAISQIGVNTAVAVSNALATPPIWVGIPMAITIGALGLAQAAKASQQKFAGGGIIQGPSSYGDNVPIMANAREMVLNQSQQAGLFSFIKNGSQGGGGNNVNVTYAPVISANGGMGSKSITDLIREDKVEFGRLLRQELKPKGYIN